MVAGLCYDRTIYDRCRPILLAPVPRDGRLQAPRRGEVVPLEHGVRPGRRLLEEYRYDALGRRVWARQRTQCEPTNDRVCVTGFARRTIWDGAQELAEIQAPYHTVGTPLQEQDSGWGVLPYSLPAGADPDPFYGRVVYGPGLTRR